jgi:hypothetical protein
LSRTTRRPGARGLDQTPVDLILPDAGLAAALAYEYLLGVAASAVEHPCGHQFVVEHDVRIGEHVERPQRQEIGIAGAGADQKHRLGLAAAPGASLAGLDRCRKLRLGLDGPPGEHRLGNRTSDDILPEAARRQRTRNGGEATAMAADQFGKLADPRGKQRFDPFTQALRQNRGSSAGADGDDHLATIDDGGKDKGRQIRAVDNIDRDALPTRARGDMVVE